MNHYEVLGIPQDAAVGDVRAAYRRRALECHPDKNVISSNSNNGDGKCDHEFFVLVAEAYRTLIDPHQRSVYDTVTLPQHVAAQQWSVGRVSDTVSLSEFQPDNEDDGNGSEGGPLPSAEDLIYECRCGGLYVVAAPPASAMPGAPCSSAKKADGDDDMGSRTEGSSHTNSNSAKFVMVCRVLGPAAVEAVLLVFVALLASTSSAINEFSSALDARSTTADVERYNFTASIYCDHNNTNPALSWCSYNNPFVLSNFLSRNSSELTTARNGAAINDTFDVIDYHCYPSEDTGEGGSEACSGIVQVRTATYGAYSNATLTKRIVIFTDVNGKMLFVDFNTNRMISTFSVGLVVEWFDVAEVLRTVPSLTPGLPAQLEQSVVFVVGNQTSILLALLHQPAGTTSDKDLRVDVCNLFQENKYAQYQNISALAFLPRTGQAGSHPSLGVVYLLWILNLDIAGLTKAKGNTVEPWMLNTHVYTLTLVPTNQTLVVPFFEKCPEGNPSGLELQATLYSRHPVKFASHHNTHTNMTFLAPYSETSISFYRLELEGAPNVQNEGGISTNYVYPDVLVDDFCGPKGTRHSVWNNTANKTEEIYRQRTTIFCVPNNETKITTVTLLSTERFKGIYEWANVIWVVIGLQNRTHTYMDVFPLEEFLQLPKNESTFMNPLGLPSTFGTDAFPCDFATQIYFPAPHHDPPYFCQPRAILRERLEGMDPIVMFDTVAIQPEVISTVTSVPANGGMNSWSSFPTSIPIPIVNTQHITVYIARKNTVEIYIVGELNTKKNSEAPSLGLIKQNSVHFLGDLQSIHASPNAMHLFAAVSRRKWELDAQNRYLDICTEHDKHPDDPFLKSFAESCHKLPPQPVNLNSFTQYVSYCSTMVWCPSLSSLYAELPQEGHYAETAAVQIPCPPGTFCIAGQKQQCPPGFYCDKEGMTSPTRCPVDPSYTRTCSDFGLKWPAPCADGSVCFVNHLPGIPAAPGYMVPPNTSSRTDFQSCPEGWWCPLGAQAWYNGSGVPQDQFCPSKTFCSNSSVLQPTICQCVGGKILNASGIEEPCNDKTLYCPAKTSNVSWCPAGSYCTLPNVSKPCVATQYCPEGTFAPKLCPAGLYCPLPDLKLVCPTGHYCQQGTIEPTPCNFLTVCPPGSKTQSRSFLAPFILAVIVVAVLLVFGIFTRYKARKDKALALMATQYEEDGTRSSTGSGEAPIGRYATPLISFENMGLTLQVGDHKGKVVLDDVTGEIPPGSFVAVMGPSGSGKSTFMHTLSGKAFYGSRSGTVRINGDEINLTEFSKVVGFVKQDDIMHRELTVNETLLFNARMRHDNEATMSPEEISNSVLKVLDLNHVRDVNIGDEKKRGISGGQRKRVNIGMEMCATPSILFLDEPTSGLDSSSSMTVCAALRSMADKGVTIIAVIHQPRYEIFQMFHKVLLLAKGGKLVYCGAPNEAMGYFENELSVQCPPHVNPPDFFMDTISGEDKEGLSVDDMAHKWKDFAANTPATQMPASFKVSEARGEVDNDTSLLQSSGNDMSGSQLAALAAKKKVPGFFAQLRYFTVRSFLQLSRDLVWFFLDLILVLVAGFFLGLVFSRSEYLPPLPKQIVNRSLSGFDGNAPPSLKEFFNRPIDDPIISEASLTCMAIGMTGVTAALRVFGNEQIVYWREASAGMSSLAYFLAKNITHLIFVALSPLLYVAPFLTFVSARAPLMQYYWVCVLLQFATTGLGYLISLIVPSGLAQLAGVVVVLVFSMFGGARPTLPQIQAMFPLLHAMPYISYIRWGQEALYLQEIKEWKKIDVDINPSLHLFGYHLDDFNLCWGLVIVFGIVFRILAFMCLALLNRDQKH